MRSTPEPTERPYEPTPTEELLARAKRRSMTSHRHRLVGARGSLTLVLALVVGGVLILAGSAGSQPSSHPPGKVFVADRIGSAYELSAEGSCRFCGARIPGVFTERPGDWGNRFLPVRVGHLLD